jgi:hypothetical protein
MVALSLGEKPENHLRQTKKDVFSNNVIAEQILSSWQEKKEDRRSQVKW